MNPRFTTILDPVHPCDLPPDADLDEARAGWLREAAQRRPPVPEEAAPLLDPLLLGGLCIIGMTRTGDRAHLDLSLSRAAAGLAPNEKWGGPVRLVFDGVRAIECSKGKPLSVPADDEIIWGELTHDLGSTLTLVLRLRSNRRLRVEAARIRFASISLPC